MNSMVSRLLTIITGDLALEFSNVRTASNKQTYNQDDQSFISILDYPWPVALGQTKSKFWFPVSSLHVALIINLNYLINGL